MTSIRATMSGSADKVPLTEIMRSVTDSGVSKTKTKLLFSAMKRKRYPFMDVSVFSTTTEKAPFPLSGKVGTASIVGSANGRLMAISDLAQKRRPVKMVKRSVQPPRW